MAENSEKDESESKTTTAEITSADADASEVEGRLGFSAADIRDRLDEDEIAQALVLTSTLLEVIMSAAIRKHYRWDREKFEKKGYNDYSLGKLMEEAVEYGALGAYEGTLNTMRTGERSLVSLRNNLVHEYGYLDDIEQEGDVQQEVEDAIKYAIEFIEEVEV